MGDETAKHATLGLRKQKMFGKAMQIEKNVARIEHNSDDCRIVVTVEHRHADAITQEEAEIQLTKELPLLFTQRVRYGGYPRSK